MVEQRRSNYFVFWKHSSENSHIGDITDRLCRDMELLERKNHNIFKMNLKSCFYFVVEVYIITVELWSYCIRQSFEIFCFDRFVLTILSSKKGKLKCSKDSWICFYTFIPMFKYLISIKVYNRKFRKFHLKQISRSWFRNQLDWLWDQRVVSFLIEHLETWWLYIERNYTKKEKVNQKSGILSNFNKHYLRFVEVRNDHRLTLFSQS